MNNAVEKIERSTATFVKLSLCALNMVMMVM